MWAAPVHLLEMQNLRSNPQLLNHNLNFNKIPGDCALKLGYSWSTSFTKTLTILAVPSDRESCGALKLLDLSSINLKKEKAKS